MEKHIRCGDMTIFREAMKKIGVEEVPAKEGIASLYGLPVKISRLMPKDRAALIDEEGNLIQIFNLK